MPFSLMFFVVTMSSMAFAADLTLKVPFETVPYKYTFTLQVSGGTAPYTYSLNHGPATVSATGQVVSLSKNGQAKITVTDAKKKKASIRFRVKEKTVIGSPAVPAPSPTPAPTPTPSPTPTPAPELPTSKLLYESPKAAPASCQMQAPADCSSFAYTRKIAVKNAVELKSALTNLKAGDLVQVGRGLYAGNFVIGLKASETLPAYVCADPGAVIDGGNVKSGYGLHLNGAKNIVVDGLTVQNVQKGIIADAGSRIILSNVLVQNIGDEAVHFRNNTKHSALANSVIAKTGLFQPDFGEGVYIGSSKNKWCPNEASCGEPDRSDCNYVFGNKISSAKAESIDVKEGTMNNLIASNEFDGAEMTGAYADSFVDVKGNSNILIDNKGLVGQCGAKPCQINGFQTHIVLAGWGDANTFAGNTIYGDLAGPVVSLQKVLKNIVTCDNKAESGTAPVNGKCQ